MTTRRNAATRIGVPWDEYVARRESGELWCSLGRHWSQADAFSPNRERSTGHAAWCRDCRNRRDRRRK